MGIKKTRIKEARTEELLALGMFGGGSRLGDRIELLLGRGRVFSPRTSKRRVAASAVLLAGCIFAASFAPRLIAFAQTPPEFDVASVKLVKPGTETEPTIRTSPDGLTVRSKNLTGLLMWAYQIEEANQISVPDWIRAEDFDITAKAAGPVAVDQLRLMLQTLLEQRFKLALHRERKIVPLYLLMVGKNGVKMHEVQAAPQQGAKLELEGGRVTFQMVNHLSELAAMLPSFLDGRPVMDQTGLSGVYEFKLNVELDADQMKRLPQAGAVFTGFGYTSGVFDAVQNLGLNLEATKGPADFLIIDHVEKPDAN
jgi:uncharacterized protein (TIGR03435 family)